MILFHTLAAWGVILLVGLKWVAAALCQSSWTSATSNQPFELGCNQMWHIVHILSPLLLATLAGFATFVLMWIMLYFNCLDMGSNSNCQILLSPNFVRYSPSRAYLHPKGLRTWCLLTSFVGSMVAVWAHVMDNDHIYC